MRGEARDVDAAIAALEPEWDALAVETGAAPFLRPGWIAAWWQAFGDDRAQLELITHRDDDGGLAGVLPVIRRRHSLAGPANPHTPIFGSVARDDGRRALFDELFGRRPRRVDLLMLEAEGDDVRCARQVAPQFAFDQRPVLRSPYLEIEGDWDAYWRSRSQNLRKTVNRCRNRVRELGTVDIDIRDGTDGLDAMLAEGFELEASGWKGEGGTAILSSPETHRFYKAVSEWAAQAGILRLAFLRVDGRAVAFHLSLEAGGVHYLLKLGHDAELQRTGAGTVLTAVMLERMFEDGLRRYEFLGAADRYKMRWTETTRDRVRLRAFSPTLAGRADMLVQVHGRAAASRGIGLLSEVPRRLRATRRARSAPSALLPLDAFGCELML